MTDPVLDDLERLLREADGDAKARAVLAPPVMQSAVGSLAGVAWALLSRARELEAEMASLRAKHAPRVARPRNRKSTPGVERCAKAWRP